MKKVFQALLILICLGTPARKQRIFYDITLIQAPAEIEGSEDVMGRHQYLTLLTADPQTGHVPKDIHQAELAFDRYLEQQTGRFRSQQLFIESVGPYNVGGRTRAVAFDVRNEKIILAGGVSGGIWKSMDGGITWSRKSNPTNRNSVTCITQDTRPGKQDTWYHGTGEIVGNSSRAGGAPFRGDGIYKSTDNGETWNPLESTQDSDPHVFNSQFQYIWDIETNPANLVEDEVLVAAFGGILRSTDGGDTWQVVLGEKLFGLESTADLNNSDGSYYTAIERSENNVLYATLSTESPSNQSSDAAGIYYSLDGQNWVDITPFSSNSRYRRIVIGSSKSNPNITYFFVDSSPIGILKHDLSRLGAGSNGYVAPFLRELPDFKQELGSLETQGSYNMMIRVHPKDPNMVFVGGTNLYRSTDGFETSDNIKWIGGYTPKGGSGVYPAHHPDQHDLLFLPSNPNVALSASDGGLILSNDISADSVEWTSRNNGFLTSQFFTIAQSKVDGDPTLIGGMQDNGTDIGINGSMDWNGIIGGDGGYAATTKDNSLWFASFQNGQTLRLTLNEDYQLTSFGRIDPGGLVESAGSLYLFINPFALDPANPNRMFCGGGNHLYFNQNVSQIPSGSQVPSSLGWEKVNDVPIARGLISAIEISSNGRRVYFGTSGGQVFRLDNADDHFSFAVQEITSGEFPKDGYVSSIAANPEDDDHLLVVFSNYNVISIYESKDGGEKFTSISGNLEENPDGTGSGPSIRWAEIIPKKTGILYLVGTSVGLYATGQTDGFNTIWVKESPAVLGSAIIPMMDYRSSDGRLVIATHGNGVFATQIPNFKKVEPPSIAKEPFHLVAAYPNPFSEFTHIEYTLPEDGEVRIDVISSAGELINTILWAPQYAGANSVTWNGTTPSGYPLSNGIYFFRISFQGKSQTGRVILNR